MAEEGHDEVIARRIREECDGGDIEGDHINADQILTSLLLELGYAKTVEAWGNVSKWYA